MYYCYLSTIDLFFNFSRFRDSRPIYNFTHLDQMIQTLWNYELRPGFEIMGNPSDFFTDFENKTQVYLFKGLVQEMTSRYVGMQYPMY